MQGDTVTAAHVVIGETTGAAAAYVGMTRGRAANTAHLVAADLPEARQQWMAVFARDRADLGPAHAAELAAAEAARYARPRPIDQLLTELHAAWTAEQHSQDQLHSLRRRRDVLRSILAVDADHADQLALLENRCRQSSTAAQQAADRAAAGGGIITAEADRRRDALLDRWNAEREAARQAAGIVLTGPGRLGLRRSAVNRAAEQLAEWAERWRPYLPTLPTEPRQLAAVASAADDRPRLRAAFDDLARRQAEAAHPEQARLGADADATQAAHGHVSRALHDARRRQEGRLSRRDTNGRPFDPAGQLAGADGAITHAEQKLAAVRIRIAELEADPALLAQPPDRLTQEREAWRARLDAERAARRAGASPPSSPRPASGVRPPEPVIYRAPPPGVGPGLGR